MFKMFNMRKVKDGVRPIPMRVKVELNTTEVFDKSIDYSWFASEEVHWTQSDTVSIHYDQDIGISYERLAPEQAVKVLVSIGNGEDTDRPLVMMNAPDESDYISGRSLVRVLNAMHGDVQAGTHRFRVYIGNQDVYRSCDLALGEASGVCTSGCCEGWTDISATMNTEVQLFDAENRLVARTDFNFVSYSAYLVIVYEDQIDDGTPKLKIYDITEW